LPASRSGPRSGQEQEQEPSGAIRALPMWAPGQIEGVMRVGGVRGQRRARRAQRKRLSRIAHSQRKATAVRSKTQGPAKAAVNHVQRLGKSS
jgi:hypothetical protein